MVAFNGWAEIDNLGNVTVAEHHQKFKIWRTDTSCHVRSMPLCSSAPPPTIPQFTTPFHLPGH